MDRIDLQVPYIEKDDAKKLGAKWDPDKKTWYIAGEIDSSLFSKWMPKSLNGSDSGSNQESDNFSF